MHLTFDVDVNLCPKMSLGGNTTEFDVTSGVTYHFSGSEFNTGCPRTFDEKNIGL